MKKPLVALILGMGVSTSALADAGHAYLALDAGQSKFKDACVGAPSTFGCRDNDTGYRVAGGYNFTPMWGAELSYADFGKAAFNGVVAAPPALILPFSATYKATAVQVSGTGTFAINDVFAILAKVGLVNSTAKLDVAVSGGGATGLSTTKTSAGFGLGVQFSFDQHTAVRAQYEDLGTIGDFTTGTTKLQFFSAGFVYRF